VVAREPQCKIVEIQVPLRYQRLGDIEGHLRVVGPPDAALPRRADYPPQKPLEEATFVGSAESVAKRQS